MFLGLEWNQRVFSIRQQHMLHFLIQAHIQDSNLQ